MPDDPPNAPPGGAAGSQDLDDGMRDAFEEYHSDLYLALQGRALSDTLVAQVDAHGAEINTWLDADDLSQVQPEDIDRIALGEAARMFGNDVTYDLEDEEQKRSRLQRIKDAVSRTPRERDADAEQKAKRDLLLEAVRDQIEAEKDAALMAGQEPLALQRISYCNLALKLMDEDRPQEALECLETSRQLGRLVSLSEEGKRAAARQTDAPRGQSRENVERKADQEAGDLRVDYANLAADIEALRRRGEALAICAQSPRFDDVRSAFNADFDAARALLDEAAELADPDDALLSISKENRAAFGTAVAKYEQAAEAFDTAQSAIAAALKAAHKEQFKAFGDLCETSKKQVTRKGSDHVGGGSVLPKKKYFNVPSEKLDLLAAKLDTLQALSVGGPLGPAHAQLADELENELRDEMAGIVDNRAKYDEAARRIAALRTELASERAQCNRERRDMLSGELDDVEKAVARDVDEALAALTTFEARMTGQVALFDPEKQALDAFLDAHKTMRKEKLDPYGKALKKVVKAAEKRDQMQFVTGDERIHRTLMQRLRKIVNYEGKHALEHILILERMDTGVPDDVTAAAASLDALKTRVASDLARLNGMMAQLEAAGPDETVRLGGDFIDFVEDLRASGKEISGRKALKETFEEESDALARYIERTKGSLEPLAQEAFANYAVLLKSMAKTTKTLETVADWQKFLTDFRAFRETVESYAANNMRPEAVDDETQVQAAIRALERCDTRIEEFARDMSQFVDFRLEPVARTLESEIEKLDGAVPERSEMQAICDMIDRKEDQLNAYANGIGGAIAPGGLAAIGARLQGASKQHAIEVREEALRAIRRRRNFLDTAASARLYRDNPFDSGGPALAAVAALSKAEATLLTLIKPS